MILYLFSLMILAHASLHMIGFMKAFRLADMPQLRLNIPKGEGSFWGLAALLFLSTTMAVLLREARWYYPAVAAVILSQALIFRHWQIAKYGTLLNIIILGVAVDAHLQWRFYQSLLAS